MVANSQGRGWSIVRPFTRSHVIASAVVRIATRHHTDNYDTHNYNTYYPSREESPDCPSDPLNVPQLKENDCLRLESLDNITARKRVVTTPLNI